MNTYVQKNNEKYNDEIINKIDVLISNINTLESNETDINKKEINKNNIFKKFCETNDNKLLDDEISIYLIEKIKDKYELLNILWNYVSQKNEEVIDNILVTCWDVYFEWIALSRKKQSTDIDEYYKGSDIAHSVNEIIYRNTWKRY